jgi:hypothetical protein
MKRTRARRRSRAERLARTGQRRLNQATAAGDKLPLDSDNVAEVVRPPTRSDVDRATFRRGEYGRIVRPKRERTVVGAVRAGDLARFVASAGDGE